MAQHNDEIAAIGRQVVYQIKIKGHLDPQWAGCFAGWTIVLEDDGNTLLSGAVVDQAALHGLLRNVRDSGMTLLSVFHVEPDQLDASDIKQ